MGIPLLADMVIIFGLALVIIYVCHHLRIPTIVGFLLTGMVAGPHGLELVTSVQQADMLAKIGVALLLFTIGIEFSLKDLLQARKAVFFGGAGQVVATVLATAGLAYCVDQPLGLAILIGCAVALSSTAIVLKALQERAEVESPHGRTVLGILIFQDVIIVLFMLLTPVLAGQSASIGADLLRLVGKAVLVTALIFVATRRIVPAILHQAARLRDREMFLLTVVVIALGIMWLTALAGLSLALGAFLAGLIISESEYSQRALRDVLPFRDVFTSLFFVSVGMLLDLQYVAQHPLLVFGLALAVYSLKSLLAGGVTLLLRFPIRTAVLSGLALGQIGEFSFLLMEAGREQQMVPATLHQLFLGVSICTMIATPFVIAGGPWIAAGVQRFWPGPAVAPAGAEAGEPAGDAPARRGHLIIVGFGLNGRNLARAAAAAGIEHVIIEMNPDTVRREKAGGQPIFYGDSTHEAVLARAGIATARVFVIAVSDPAATRRTVVLARRMNPTLTVVARTRFTSEINALATLGANHVVPEEFETSVEIFSLVLAHYGVPRNDIERFIADVRNENYQMLRTLSPASAPPADLRLHIPDVEIATLRVGDSSPMAGQSLAELALRREHNVTLLGIRRESETIPNPGGDTRLCPGDLLILVGKPESLQALVAQNR